MKRSMTLLFAAVSMIASVAPAEAQLVHVSRGSGPPQDPNAARARLAARLTPLDSRLILIQEPESPRAVAYRLLRDSLVAKDLPRILVVAGTAPQDGTTTCAVRGSRS